MHTHTRVCVCVYIYIYIYIWEKCLLAKTELRFFFFKFSKIIFLKLCYVFIVLAVFFGYFLPNQNNPTAVSLRLWNAQWKNMISENFLSYVFANELFIYIYIYIYIKCMYMCVCIYTVYIYIYIYICSSTTVSNVDDKSVLEWFLRIMWHWRLE